MIAWTIWRRGRAALLARRDEGALTLTAFFTPLDDPGAPSCVRGTAVYLTGQREVVPVALSLNLRHNGCCTTPWCCCTCWASACREYRKTSAWRWSELPHGFRHVTLRFGFAEKPDVPTTLRLHRDEVGFAPDEASYFLGNEMPVPSMRPELSPWQDLRLPHPQCGTGAGLLPHPAAACCRAVPGSSCEGEPAGSANSEIGIK
jgi:KUP system potassium uptake protein